MDDDLSDLYQEIILSHNKRPRNEGELEPRNHEAEGFNPLCGDRITVHVQEDDGKISDARFTGESCAIARASASMMTSEVKNLTREEFEKRMAEIVELLTATEEPKVDLAEMGDVAALVGVRKFPARIKCATLGWHTLKAALDDQSKVTTE